MTSQPQVKNSLWNDFIEQEVGCPVPTPLGAYVLLKIFKREETTKQGIIIPKSIIDQDQYHYRLGKVMAMGDEAFEGERFPKGPRCEIGDWVVYRRYELSLIKVNGVDLGFLYDDKICLKLDDPYQLEHLIFDGRN